MTMTKKQINQIIRDYVQGKLDEFDLEQAVSPPDNPDKLDDQIEAYDAAVDHLGQDFVFGRHVKAESHTVDQILKELNITLKKDSPSYQLLCRELLKAEIRTLEANKSKLACNLEGTDLDSILKDLNIQAELEPSIIIKDREPVSNEQDIPSITLGELINDYKKMKLKSKKWTAGTVRNHQVKIDTMLKVLGNRPVNLITIADMRKLAELLEILPPGFARKPELFDNLGKIKPDDLKGKHPETVDVTTRRAYMGLIKSVFTYAEENEYIKKNPVISGLIPPKKQNTREQRQPFDDPQDLERIFNPETYLKWAGNQPSKFWLPLLALYTGCRLEELASLYCEHVHQVEGLWCIEVNNDYDRKVKNLNAIRTVPLHPTLVDNFKFPDYVNRVKAGRVFPELKMVNYKYGHEFSKRFGYYRKETIGITDSKKTFHSFRHNVSDHLYQKLVTEALIEELTGRAGKTQTRTRYTKALRVPTLYKECILKLEYEAEETVLKELMERSGTW